MSLLDVQDLTLRFGGVRALDGVSFAVEEGALVALVGPNGAGKSSVFNCVSGLYRPNDGSIEFAGENILTLPSHALASRGIGRTFQNLALFPRLTVLENVLLGGHTAHRSNALACALRWPGERRREREARGRALEVLTELRLAHLADQPAAGLPFGTLKRIEIARAVMSGPCLLLLDEPAAGLTHGEVEELGTTIRSLRETHGLTVLLVEHHMGLVMTISERVIVLNLGQVIAQGPPGEVSTDPAVVAAYLGAAA
ncbi:ABC transporter ATP-binding protein [Streptosporangium sp. NBC_01810]|uniref:ABC transporter ATP-binding protein n=1 Tax=Streptosporangium sp. NBC_01810 TaxID=2975951 RepID=UPI002DDB1B1D|nr:ABC transporter ATP-binding protein [Streptosporangium sp. NBC_01810]WSA29340.1 ABC transporter ATP-binding protein [Streptosporangium sp. NBC_01810]